jgi:hypothetical protein
MALENAMTAAELTRAQLRVMRVCATGQQVSLTKPIAGSKDEFGSPTGSVSTLNLMAHPIRFSPYERRVLQSVAWAENTDVLCYTSKMALDLLMVTIEQARRYKSLKYQGKSYDIRYIELYSGFGTDHLYVIIGGKAGGKI